MIRNLGLTPEDFAVPPRQFAVTQLRLAVRIAMNQGLGAAQIQAAVAEETINEVDYPQQEEVCAAD